MEEMASVSNFRNNIFSYIKLATKKQEQIGVTKGKRIIGWFVPNTATKGIKRDKVDVFLDEVKKLQKKYPIRAGKNLSRDIDKILYGKK